MRALTSVWESGRMLWWRTVNWGWGVADVDYGEDDIVTQGARERWLSVLEPLSVQPLTIEGLPVVDKSLPVSCSAAGCLVLIHPS